MFQEWILAAFLSSRKKKLFTAGQKGLRTLVILYQREQGEDGAQKMFEGT